MNYHNRPELSSSMLKKYANGTPLDFWAAYEDPNRMPFQPTDAMRQGSLTDCLITEPGAVSSKYLVAPKCDRRTTAGKAEWADAQELARSRCAELIPSDWMHTAQMIASKLQCDPVASEYLQGQGQVPHFWRDADNEVDCRYLPDLEDPENGLLVDLKKTKSANPRLFARQSYALGYDIQVSHYQEGYKDRYGEYPEKIVMLAYEWVFPFNFSINIITPELLEVGRQRRLDAIEGIQACRGTNEWPSWGVSEMKAPSWAKVDDPANSSDISDLQLEGI